MGVVAMSKRTLPITDEIRLQLSRGARNKNARVNSFSRTRPVEWRPQSVVTPQSVSDLPFTPSGAWQYIADLLDNGHNVDEIELKQPPGCTGYVLLADGGGGRPQIYIKLEIVGNKVYGRSFHYSTQ